ncbi:zinc finger BED domain-containing protein 4-like [Anthonomus grandis grandis]|uniref:zinc finger BED domain-containing protein 4-like n=1 Tax=Anthonomus grandis grandis TaxID=2921223 RepID=UPI002166B921|nr:zinc finger BED domain-containing protein 4-like [Anthonomus grandis grandis]
MSPPKSILWKYFEKKSSTHVVCKICMKEVKTSGNTSNMAKHLKIHKHINLNKTPAPTDNKSTKSSNCSESSKGNSDCEMNNDESIASTSTMDIEGQHESSSSLEYGSAIVLPETINKVFDNIRSFKTGGKQNMKITQAILYFICADYRPFYATQCRGFQRLMREVAPLYKIPCLDTFKNALDMKYDVVSENYKKKFATIPFFSMTCNIWTEMMSCRSFLGITIHYISDAELKNTAIEVHELNERHKADYIGANLSELLLKWNISSDKLVAIVTDSGANMVSAIHITFGKEKHIPCFAHLINLVSESILTRRSDKMKEKDETANNNENVLQIIEKVRTIVKWVKSSVINSDELRRLRTSTGIAQGSVKKFSDVKTRWNSTFYMLERFVEMAEMLNDMLLNKPKAPPMVTAVEVCTIKEILLVLKSLEYLTKETMGEQYITISKVIPLLLCLSRNLEAVDLEQEMVKNLKISLQAEIKKRFGKIEYVSYMAIATILDVRFKTMYFTQPQAQAQALSHIRQMIKNTPNQYMPDIQEVADCGNIDDKDNFWSYHTTLTQRNLQQQEQSENLKDELDLYLKRPLAPLTADPLKEWAKLKPAFPVLFNIAMKHFVVVATSVPSERLFSRTGNTVTQSRNRLLGSRLNKLCFLASIPENDFFL